MVFEDFEPICLVASIKKRCFYVDVELWGVFVVFFSTKKPTKSQGLSDPLVIDVRDPNEVAEGKGGPPSAIPGSVPWLMLLL